MEYLYYNKPMIYIKKDEHRIDYIKVRFQFAKPDNGNYIVKTDEFISMYLEISPEKLFSFDKAIENVDNRIMLYEDKLKWHKRSDFLPPQYVVQNIITQEKLEETITEKMKYCTDENKIENYKRQIRDIHRCLRRLHKRVYEFETCSIGCDIHQLEYIDFSKEKLLEKIEELNKTKQEIVNYERSVKNEKPFII